MTLQALHYIRDYLPCALNTGGDMNGFEPVTVYELIKTTIDGIRFLDHQVGQIRSYQ